MDGNNIIDGVESHEASPVYIQNNRGGLKHGIIGFLLGAGLALGGGYLYHQKEMGGVEERISELHQAVGSAHTRVLEVSALDAAIIDASTVGDREGAYRLLDRKIELIGDTQNYLNNSGTDVEGVVGRFDYERVLPEVETNQNQQ